MIAESKLIIRRMNKIWKSFQRNRLGSLIGEEDLPELMKTCQVEEQGVLLYSLWVYAVQGSAVADVVVEHSAEDEAKLSWVWAAEDVLDLLGPDVVLVVDVVSHQQGVELLLLKTEAVLEDHPFDEAVVGLEVDDVSEEGPQEIGKGVLGGFFDWLAPYLLNRFWFNNLLLFRNNPSNFDFFTEILLDIRLFCWIMYLVVLYCLFCSWIGHRVCWGIEKIWDYYLGRRLNLSEKLKVVRHWVGVELLMRGVKLKWNDEVHLIPWLFYYI